MTSTNAPPASAATGSRAHDLSARFRAVRAWTERLCEPLAAEDHVVQSMPDASPAKWHLAHTSWFFETFVLARAPGYGAFDANYDFLFNSYYDAVGERHARSERGLLSRPTVAEVRAYRGHVDRALLARLAQPDAAADADLLAVVELGLQHEQQHQELLLTDIQHAFWVNPLRPAYRARPARPVDRPAAAPLSAPSSWVAFPGGVHSIGHAGPGFAFDNEGPRHRVHLRPFELASRLVTNAEYRRFVEDGGYRRPAPWLSAGWQAVVGQGWEAPLYWFRQGDAWWRHTLGGSMPLADDEPVSHLSLFEADAFARWAGARLPTEAEWEVAAAPEPLRGSFAESERLGPAPAAGGGGLEQLHGELWQWTGSAYAAYPGYRPAAGALGEYNGKFMCNQHVLRGSSCATPGSHARTTYRNFFPPEARWQFSGLRLARDA